MSILADRWHQITLYHLPTVFAEQHIAYVTFNRTMDADLYLFGAKLFP